MNPGKDNQVDWAAATTHHDDRVAEGDLPGRSRPEKRRDIPRTRTGVMDTLLGANNLVASDVDGGDPYNATGRHYRR